MKIEQDKERNILLNKTKYTHMFININAQTLFTHFRVKKKNMKDEKKNKEK